MGSSQPIIIQLRLQGQQQVLAGSAAASGGLRSLGVASHQAGLEMEFAGRRSFIMQQAIFTMRRVMYGATLATVGLTSEVVRLGLSYNSAMEQSTLAMTNFLGSTSAAHAELQKLYRIAALTPFEFQPLVQAASRLLAVQQNAKLVNQELMAIGDASAGLGRGQEGINRLTLAFQELSTIGIVQGRQLRMMELVGVPAGDILARRFGLSPQQIANIGRLHIPASAAIPALIAGIEGGPLGGMATKQRGTMQGILSTIHDYAAQLSGTILHPLYGRVENRLRGLVFGGPGGTGPDLTKAYQRGGLTGVVGASTSAMGFGQGPLNLFKALRDIAHNLWIVITKELIPSFHFLFGLMGGGHTILALIGGMLSFMAHNMTLMKVVMVPLIALWGAWHVLLLANNIAGRINVGISLLMNTADARSNRLKQLSILYDRIRLATTYAVIWAYRIYFTTMQLANRALIWLQINTTRAAIAQRVQAAATWLSNTAIGAAFRSTVFYNDATIFGYRRALMMQAARWLDTAAAWAQAAATAAVTAATWAWNAALDANPIVWIIVGVAALIAGLVLLVLHWRTVVRWTVTAWHAIREGGVWLYNWFKGHWPLLLEILMGPFGWLYAFIHHFFPGLAGTINRIGSTIWNGLLTGFKWVINRIIDAWNWLADHLNVHLPGFLGGGRIGLPTIPHMAQGGTILHPGVAMVGERGPELLYMPRGASVAPLQRGGGYGGPSVAFEGTVLVTSQIFLDKRQIAEAVAEYMSDRTARA